MAMSLAAGCAKRSAETSASPGVMSEDDDLAGLEQQLAQRTAQLQAVVGPRATQGASDEASPEGADANSAADGVGGGAIAAKSGPPQPAPSAPVGGASRPRASEDNELSEPAGPSSRRCEQVCDIAAAICGLEQQICGLVPRHPDDVRYQAACERAAGDCRFATEACHACT